ncbi:MAG: aminoacyl-tRNA hydrolase [Actinobacteria bacterium]|uniref:Unannotated protein n=1 Tax=freshwater metagenome TaxID=449393 RepID=A0A6J7KL79_9ZZZZ|nr:aminoacyl-tRNA hydrolase [Actinomycetota bacterium]
MADEIVVRGSVMIPRSELSWRFSRSSGPGGQGVNTTDSRVQLIFDLANSPSIPERLRERAIQRLGPRLTGGCLVITASDSRAQLQNRRLAELRLAQVLDQAFAPAPRARRPTKPSKGATDRRIKEKKGRGATKRMRGSAGADTD